jgi:DNA-binding IclR family transcriptional regulator
MRNEDVSLEEIERVFRDPGAAWTVDEIAGRFGTTLGRAIRLMSDLEAIDVVRRVGDEFVPGPQAKRAS